MVLITQVLVMVLTVQELELMVLKVSKAEVKIGMEI